MGIFLHYFLKSKTRFIQNCFNYSLSYPIAQNNTNNNDKNRQRQNEMQLKLSLIRIDIPKISFHLKKDKKQNTMDLDLNVQKIKEELNISIYSKEYRPSDINLFFNDALVIMGKNGSGKTTFLKNLSNLISPNNTQLTEESQEKLINLNIENNKIGICFNEDIYDPLLTVKQNLTFLNSLSNLSIIIKGKMIEKC